MNAKELKTRAFKDKALFNSWLAKNHSKSPGLWVRLFKKASGKKTVTYEEALHEALCFGWIDGQKKSLDEVSWIQKFTPRGSRSVWSKRNTVIVEKLILEGRMKASGLQVVEAAKADGRWGQAYDSPKDMKIPEYFLEAVKKNRKAYEYFQTLKRASLYSIVWRLQTAKKEETRLRRMAVLLEKLEKKQKLGFF